METGGAAFHAVSRRLAAARALVYLFAMTERTTDRADSGDSADFGFRTVAADEKQHLVRGVFDSVASRYDLMNDLMSGGLHRLWKRELVAMLRPSAGRSLLDIAGGTGDIAFLWRRRGGGPAIVCDINAGMVARGRDRAIDRGIVGGLGGGAAADPTGGPGKESGGRPGGGGATAGPEGGLAWLCGDAELLPLPDRSVDAATIAFGLRNVTDKPAALRDMHRVLRPGGRFLCLEFSAVTAPLLGELYDRYSFAVLPRIGEIVTGDGDAYRYLVESIRRFPPQPELADMMTEAGFGRVRWRDLTGGVVAIHSGWRI